MYILLQLMNLIHSYALEIRSNMDLKSIHAAYNIEPALYVHCFSQVLKYKGMSIDRMPAPGACLLI